MARPHDTTAESLRGEIDRGETHDKIRGSDPAAAPLGTDAEAGGTPTSAAALRQASETERRPPIPEPTSPGEASQGWMATRTKRGSSSVFAGIYLLLVIICLAGLVIWLAT